MSIEAVLPVHRECGWLAEYVACMLQFKRDAPWRRWQDASKEDRALAFEEELGREQRGDYEFQEVEDVL